MFFTVVIPTYNPKDFLEQILSSIARNDCKDDIEVIISDDRSDEPFDDELKRIKSEYKLNIRKITNRTHFGAPMMGRQNGANKAKGKWICFADQDDFWLDGAFDLVKEHIETNNIHNYCRTDFWQVNMDGTVTDIIDALNWTHGKFYENEFWKKYHVRYHKIKYCEDICLSVLIECLLVNNALESAYFPCFTYAWKQREDSLSKANGFSDLSYFYLSFNDYIKGSFGTYVTMFEKVKHDESVADFYKGNIYSVLLHLYYYFQGMLSQSGKIDSEYYSLAGYYFKRFIKILGLNESEFYDLIIKEFELFRDTRNVCFSQIPFVEHETFREFINKIVKEDNNAVRKG